MFDGSSGKHDYHEILHGPPPAEQPDFSSHHHMRPVNYHPIAVQNRYRVPIILSLAANYPVVYRCSLQLLVYLLPAYQPACANYHDGA
jgi:hypothetical protein